MAQVTAAVSDFTIPIPVVATGSNLVTWKNYQFEKGQQFFIDATLFGVLNIKIVAGVPAEDSPSSSVNSLLNSVPVSFSSRTLAKRVEHKRSALMPLLVQQFAGKKVTVPVSALGPANTVMLTRLLSYASHTMSPRLLLADEVSGSAVCEFASV